MKKFLILAFLLLANQGLATTRYVAKTGSDSNTCAQSTSTSTPKLTITSGLSCMSAGDELQVRTGTYAENLAITNLGGTSWTNQISIKNYPGETPVIQPTSGARLLYFQGANTHYLTFDGFVFDAINTTSDAIKVTCGACTGSDSAHHVRIKNSEIKNSQLCGVLTSTGSDYVELSNLNVHDNGLSNVCHGVYIHSSYGILENSLLHDNKKIGAQFYSDTGGVNYGIIRGNTFYNNGIGGLGSGAGHLAVGSGTGHLIYNNVLYGSTANVDGITVNYNGSNIGVYNNTVYGLGYTGIVIGSAATNTTVRNNIASTNSTANISNAGTGTIFSNNLCSSNGTGCTSPRTEPASSTFVNAATNDFHLKAASNAIENGYNLATIFTTDFATVTRADGGNTGANWDIGAYEYVYPPATITVTAPNGGESWEIGTTQTITWTSVGTGGSMDITADLDGDGTYETTIVAPTTNDGTHDWTVAGTANANCKIKVKDSFNSTNDVSDAVFALVASATGTITITSPVSGQVCPKGSDVIIGWTSENVTGNVKIELSRNNGTTWETIVATTPFDSSNIVYTATTPSTSTAKIKVTSLNNTNVYGTSSAFRLGGRLLLVLQ